MADFTAARLNMVESQVRTADVTDVRIHDAMRVIPRETFVPAGKAYLAYRRRGGERRSPLPDFYIGAHALVGNMRLLTRDALRFRTYFPKLNIVSP